MFRRPTLPSREERIEQRQARLTMLTAGAGLHSGVYGGGTAGADPKTQPYRDPVLLEMARGRPCLLMVPAICNHRLDTTVAAHSNLSIHGKAGARKADDFYAVESCRACHYWLDFGKASAATKLDAFMNGHALQVLAWRLRATDPTEPERFRRAARRALERLNATPLPNATRARDQV